MQIRALTRDFGSRPRRAVPVGTSRSRTSKPGGRGSRTDRRQSAEMCARSRDVVRYAGSCLSDSLSLGDRRFAGARKTRRSRAEGGDSAHGSAWAQKSGAGLWRCREEPAGWRVVRRRPALYFASPPPSTRLRLPRCRTTPRELEFLRAPTLADDERPAHAVNTIQPIANRAAGVGEGAKRSKAEAGPSSRRPRRILEHCPGEGTPISDRPSHERRPLPDSGRARTETDHARNAVIR